MNGGLAIFVKTPGYSPLKTRLAASMGAEAERWYCYAVKAVESVALEARASSGINTYWAVAETEALKYNLWQALPKLSQGEGELGERMGRVMRILIRQHGYGILVGADAPQICPADIQAAADFLDHDNPRIVLGPARDGGFWCVGSNSSFPIELWQSVSYSQPNTRTNFAAAFSPFAEIWNLRTLTDVDEATDLALCHVELQALDNATPEQRALIEAFSQFELTA